MALTKNSIVDVLVEKYKLKRREAVDFLDTILADIKERVSKGEKVPIATFGYFTLDKKYYQRKRRDTPVDEAEPWRVVHFTPYQLLRARIQRADIEISRDED